MSDELNEWHATIEKDGRRTVSYQAYAALCAKLKLQKKIIEGNTADHRELEREMETFGMAFTDAHGGLSSSMVITTFITALRAKLALAEQALPVTFFGDRHLDERISRLASSWVKAVQVTYELEQQLTQVTDQLRLVNIDQLTTQAELSQATDDLKELQDEFDAGPGAVVDAQAKVIGGYQRQLAEALARIKELESAGR